MRLIKHRAGSQRSSAPVAVTLHPVDRSAEPVLSFYSGKPDEGVHYMLHFENEDEIRAFMSAIHVLWNGYDDMTARSRRGG